MFFSVDIPSSTHLISPFSDRSRLAPQFHHSVGLRCTTSSTWKWWWSVDSTWNHLVEAIGRRRRSTSKQKHFLLLYQSLVCNSLSVFMFSQYIRIWFSVFNGKTTVFEKLRLILRHLKLIMIKFTFSGLHKCSFEMPFHRNELSLYRATSSFLFHYV